MCGTKVLKQKSPKIEETVLLTSGRFFFLGSGVYQTLKRLALGSTNFFFELRPMQADNHISGTVH
jgi:hypothetical protein